MSTPIPHVGWDRLSRRSSSLHARLRNGWTLFGQRSPLGGSAICAHSSPGFAPHVGLATSPYGTLIVLVLAGDTVVVAIVRVAGQCRIGPSNFLAGLTPTWIRRRAGTALLAVHGFTGRAVPVRVHVCGRTVGKVVRLRFGEAPTGSVHRLAIAALRELQLRRCRRRTLEGKRAERRFGSWWIVPPWAMVVWRLRCSVRLVTNTRRPAPAPGRLPRFSFSSTLPTGVVVGLASVAVR
jgi:hypothetical protein